MPRIPDVIYIVDPHKEQIAVKEAKNLVSQLAMVDKTLIQMRSM